MTENLNLKTYELFTGRNPWSEIQYRAAANKSMPMFTPEQEDIFRIHTLKMLNNDRKKEEKRLVSTAVMRLFYNPSKAYYVYGITRELINYAALTAGFRDRYTKDVKSEKVSNAIKEEIQSSPAGITVSEKSIDDFLQEFGKEIIGSMENVRREFIVNQEAVTAYIG